MAHTISGLHNIRKNETRRLRNKAVKSALRTQMKKVLTAVAKKDKDVSKTELQRTYSLLDRAVAKGVIHKNNASRSKARLSARVNSVGTAAKA